MALFLPPAFSLKNFAGGYNSNADFNTLQDNQTNDAKNIEISRVGSMLKRNGYARRLNTAINGSSLKEINGLEGVPITGHYQLIKSGNETELMSEVVGAGANLWNYTSATASTILTGLKNRSDAYWYFTQIQSPEPDASGTDDVVVGVNGFDNPVIWNGVDDSATYLSDVSGASGVAVGKFIVSLYNRLYIANINDTSDVDSNVKVIISGFDTDGVPTPHVFPPELFFYVGGSDPFGEVTGLAVLGGDLIIFKRRATYKFTPGSGRLIDTSSLVQMDQNIGCVAPGSIATVGNSVVFLSEYGVYAFNGNNFQYIGGPIEQDLNNVNFNRKQTSRGIYHKAKAQYWLSVSSESSGFNDVVFVYDLTRQIWYPPYRNMKANVLSNFRAGNQEKILAGDHQGYLYELDKGTADGHELGKTAQVDDVGGFVNPVWTERVETITNNDMKDVAYNGTNLYVAVGNKGLIYTSADGLTWTGPTLKFGASDLMQSVAFGGALWVSVGNGGIIYTSPDGATWTSRVNPMTGTIYDVAYDGSGLWCVVGTNNEIATSPDGTTWTARTSDFTAGAQGLRVAHDQTGTWVVGDLIAGELQTSTDGTTWVLRTSGLIGSVGGIAYGNGTWVAIANYYAPDAQLAYSTDSGVTWTTNEFKYNGDQVQRLAFDGTTTFYAVGDNGQVATSTDGISFIMRHSGFIDQQLNGIAIDPGVLLVVTGVEPPAPNGVILSAPDVNNATYVTLKGDALNLTDGIEGYAGTTVKVVEGTGENDTYPVVLSYTDTSATRFEVATTFTAVTFDSSSYFALGGIDAHYRTKDYSLGNEDLDKLYRGVTVRAKQFGNFNFNINYIVDFNDLSNAGTATITQFNENYVTWDVTNSNTYWDVGKWGPAKTKITNKGLRFLSNQTLVGKHLAIRFANDGANEPFEIFSLDMLVKEMGRRT